MKLCECDTREARNLLSHDHRSTDGFLRVPVVHRWLQALTADPSCNGSRSIIALVQNSLLQMDKLLTCYRRCAYSDGKRVQITRIVEALGLYLSYGHSHVSPEHLISHSCTQTHISRRYDVIRRLGCAGPSRLSTKLKLSMKLSGM